jgi:ubiquinone/menaquinone biosynthesis C-methylase UbiE
MMITNLTRYQRIAPLYDLLDLPFERRRYSALRPLLFQNLSGKLLDAGIGTGQNCAYYPQDVEVAGIDTSPAMLERARRRCPTVAAEGAALSDGRYRTPLCNGNFRFGGCKFPVLRFARRSTSAGTE